MERGLRNSIAKELPIQLPDHCNSVSHEISSRVECCWPSSKLAMGSAKATVTQRGIIAHVRDGSIPRRRPRPAVEYKEKSDDTTTAVMISAACRWITCSMSLSSVRTETFGLCPTQENGVRQCCACWEIHYVPTFRCRYMENAKDRITDPRKPINISPAPGLPEFLVK